MSQRQSDDSNTWTLTSLARKKSRNSTVAYSSYSVSHPLRIQIKSLSHMRTPSYVDGAEDIWMFSMWLWTVDRCTITRNRNFNWFVWLLWWLSDFRSEILSHKYLEVLQFNGFALAVLLMFCDHRNFTEQSVVDLICYHFSIFLIGK